MLVELQIGVDVPAYMTANIYIPDELKGNDEAIRKFVREEVERNYEEGSFTGFDPEWENQTALRVVHAKVSTDDDSGENLFSDEPVKNCWTDFGMEVMNALRSKVREGYEPPCWLMDIAKQWLPEVEGVLLDTPTEKQPPEHPHDCEH